MWHFCGNISTKFGHRVAVGSSVTAHFMFELRESSYFVDEGGPPVSILAARRRRTGSDKCCRLYTANACICTSCINLRHRGNNNTVHGRS